MLREAKVEVSMNESEIRKYVEQKLDEHVHEALFLVSADTIAERCSMSKRYAEEVLLSDVRFRSIEKRRSRMRFYLWKEAKEVIEEIINEW